MGYLVAAATICAHAGTYVPPKVVTLYAPCSYCSLIPTPGQQESRCSGCGAPLKAKDVRAEIKVRHEVARMKMQIKAAQAGAYL